MTYVMVHHQVKDYGKWKPIFDADGQTLKDGGCEGFRLLRDEKDPNDLTILAKFDTTENAHRFFESTRLQETMDKAGVIDKPEIHFLEEIETKGKDELVNRLRVA